MKIEEGIIEDTSKRKALVSIQQSAACATCKSHDTCDVRSDKKIVVEVFNDLQANIGDRVEISMPASSLLKLSLLVYFIPVVALIAGACLGARLAQLFNVDSTPASVIGGGLAMAIVFCGLKWFDRGTKASDKYYPRMTRILFSSAGPSPDDSR